MSRPVNDPGPYYRPEGPNWGPPRSRVPWLPIIIGVVLIGVAMLILLVLLYPTAFGFSTPSYPYRFGLFGGFFFLFFILIVIFFIVRVAFWSSRASRYGRRNNNYGPRSGGPGNYGANRPEMVARMRYARGEITREQYEQIMRDLGRPPSTP